MSSDDFSLDNLRIIIYEKLDEYCDTRSYCRNEQIEALLQVAISIILDSGGEINDIDILVECAKEYMQDIMNRRLFN
jgi:hypothetical protein